MRGNTRTITHADFRRRLSDILVSDTEQLQRAAGSGTYLVEGRDSVRKIRQMFIIHTCRENNLLRGRNVKDLIVVLERNAGRLLQPFSVAAR